MEEAKHNAKIKFICRIKDNAYHQECYLDNAVMQTEEANSAVRGAERFFSAFSPEVITKQMSAQYGDNFVLVFRTSEQQMQNFCDILTDLC